jgi:hypothetical protein
MNRVITLAIVGLMASISQTHAAPQPSIEFGGEVFLVKDKSIAGLDINLFLAPTFGINLEAAMAFVNDDAPREGTDASFLGFLLAPHVFYNHRIHNTVDGRIGLGVDVWPLSGINGDEVKLAMPVYGEINVGVTPSLRAFVRARLYLVSSDGLSPGEDFDGETQVPLLISIGLSGRSAK